MGDRGSGEGSTTERTGHRAAALPAQRPFIYTADSALPAPPPMRIGRALCGRGPGREGRSGGAPAAGASRREGAGGCGTYTRGKGGRGPPAARRSSDPLGRAGAPGAPYGRPPRSAGLATLRRAHRSVTRLRNHERRQHSRPGPELRRPHPGSTSREGRAGAPQRQQDLPVPCGGRDTTHTRDSRRPCGVTFRALHKRHSRLGVGEYPAVGSAPRAQQGGVGGFSAGTPLSSQVWSCNECT
ncbi:translation initiation factor IF-2-like isoform X2 [Passer montanus]|uniref:translation initiation factor IF-2-like isoform X2 n=1 Tax=Passer montanus TaxID=9160 RepID=UPI001960FAB0|nr:translation initiation factor IF-2-like isoform X2 [Passer montanus]